MISLLVLRDIEDRGRDLEQVLHQYTTLVKPAFEEFCLPVSFSIIKSLRYNENIIILRAKKNTNY